MRRYEFRAEKVLRIRRLQADIARAGVATARREEVAAQGRVTASQARYAELPVDLAAVPVTAFLASRDQAGHRAGAVVAAQQRHAAAQESTAVAMDEWHGATRKVEGLERLDQRGRAEHAVEARRYEDVQVDEIVIARARRTA